MSANPTQTTSIACPKCGKTGVYTLALGGCCFIAIPSPR